MSAAAALKQPVEIARARCAPGLSRARMLLQYVLMLLRMKRQSVFRSAVTPVAGGGSDKWFFCNFQSSIPTSKTDAIQSIHYQSTADAIRVSQQPLNVYQGQLRPIKPIRHHNVGRHRDEGRALNEASLKRSGKRSCGH